MKTLTIMLTVATALAATSAPAHADTNQHRVAPNSADGAGSLITASGQGREASVRISGQRTVLLGRRARFLVTGHSGSGRWLQISLKLAGHPCGAPEDSAEGTLTVLSGGDFRVPGNTRFERQGRYRVCVWVFENIFARQPEASASYTLRVTGR